MSKQIQTTGYIPPRSFAFADLTRAMRHYVCAVTSVECTRYLHYVATHPAQKDNYTSRFLNVYILAEWAQGRIEEAVFKGRERGARDSIRRWAHSMVEFNTIFKELKIIDPIGVLETHGVIRRLSGDLGWEADLDVMQAVLPANEP